MSYILDALNKSEQERATRVPNLKTVHHLPADYRSPVVPRMLLAAIVLLLLAAAAWFFQSERSRLGRDDGAEAPAQSNNKEFTRPLSTGRSATAQQNEEPDSGMPAAVSASPKPVLPEPSVDQLPTRSASPSVEPIQVISAVPANPVPAASASPPSRDDREILTRGDLLPEVQAKIAMLAFSSHIYAEESSWRQVTINGTSRSEGDLIELGISLVEITNDGVIVEYQNQLIRLDVIDNWVDF